MYPLKLEQFCDQLETTSYYTTPFETIGEYVGTTGKILAMTLCQDDNPNYPNIMSVTNNLERIVKINGVIKKLLVAFATQRFEPFKTTIRDGIQCEACNGSGFATLEWCGCQEFFGTTDDCQKCNSNGYIANRNSTKVCSICRGLGRVYEVSRKNHLLYIDDMAFKPCDITLINQPQTTYALFDKALLAKLDDFKIMIMSVDPSYLP